MVHAVRRAGPDDADDVVRLLDAAMLEFDRERARRRVAAGDVLVAVVGESATAGECVGGAGADADGSAGADDRVVGACVLGPVDGDRADVDPHCGDAAALGDRVQAGDAGAPPTEIEQIAVHRSRRGRGVGTALVAAAADRVDGPLVARFRESVRPFYDALGFEVVAADADDSDADTDDDSDDDTDGGAGDDRLLGVRFRDESPAG
ncbi:MAG: GNAT family N-acetyltransferase [Haloquadratum sp.]